MHPRNIYRTPLDFHLLSRLYPQLLKFMIKRKRDKIDFDFRSRDAVCCLTKCLLKKDFNLDIIIPEDTLVPRLPLRLNYILWIEDLLQSSNINSRGIDIGTGATCIYPLLASRKNGWKMIGSDIFDNVVNVARENVSKNCLEHLITVTKTSSLLELMESVNEEIDFCMCNPPFFNVRKNENELLMKENRKKRLKRAECQISGTTNELSSMGGEIEFVKCLINDSLVLKSRIKIYTTMLGCKSSLRHVIDFLNESSVNSYTFTTFIQGKTTRWAVAWTYTEIPLSSSYHTSLRRKKTRKPLVHTFSINYDFESCIRKSNELLEQLQLEFQELEKSDKKAKWMLKAHQNTWTGLRKKRRLEKMKQVSTISETNNQKLQTNEINYKNHKLGHEEIGIEYSAKCEIIFEAELKLEDLQTDDESTKGKISLEIKHLNGQRDAPGQMIYFFKNRLTQPS